VLDELELVPDRRAVIVIRLALLEIGRVQRDLNRVEREGMVGDT